MREGPTRAGLQRHKPSACRLISFHASLENDNTAELQQTDCHAQKSFKPASLHGPGR